MIKIQSSYRIIKSNHVHCEGESQVIIKKSYENKTVFNTPSQNDEKNDHLINLDSIKEEIRLNLIEDLKKEIYTQTEEERRVIIETANKQAEELFEEAKKQGFDSGLKEGFNKGYKHGIEEANDEASKIRENAIRIVDDAQTYVKDYFSQSQDEIIRLAADMAEAIVHTTINESSESIMMLVNPIIQKFSKTENIIITCHPDIVDTLKLYQYKLEELCPNAVFTILVDGNLEKNGCTIENENQIIDLQIKKQIESILESIKDLENME